MSDMSDSNDTRTPYSGSMNAVHTPASSRQVMTTDVLVNAHTSSFRQAWYRYLSADTAKWGETRTESSRLVAEQHVNCCRK